MGKIEKVFELLEPRILLDASLDFSLSDTLDAEATIESMSALIRAFEEQFDPEQAGLLNLLQDELGDGLNGTDDLFSLVEGQDGTGFGELEDLFERVRLSGLQVVEEYRNDLNEIFSLTNVVATDALDLGSLRNDPADPDNLTQLEVLDDLALNGVIRINGVVQGPGQSFSDFLQSDEVITQVFGNDLLWAGDDIADRIDTFFDALIVEEQTEDDTSVEPTFTPVLLDMEADGSVLLYEDLKAQFAAGYDALVASANLAEIQRISLEDVDDEDGSSIITFTQTTADEVAVAVQLPQVQTLLDRLDLDADLRTILPIDFAFNGDSGVFEYSIAASTLVDDQGTLADTDDDTVTGALALSDFGLASDETDPDAVTALFEFGLPTGTDINYIDPLLGGGIPETSLGLLTGTLTSFETGHFGLFAAGNMWAGLGVDIVAVAAVDPLIDVTVDSTFIGAEMVDFTMRATELDAEPSAQLLELDQTAELELVRFNFGINLPLSLEAAVSFEASLTQAVTFGEVTQDPTVAGFADSVDVDFSVTSFAGVDAQFIDPLNRLANSFYDASTDVLTGFFDSLGDGVSSVLNDAGFSLGIPLTDFDITDSFGQIADVLQAIPDLFAFSPDDFGFVESVNFDDFSEIDETGVFVDLASDLSSQTGNALSDEQAEALATQTSLTFAIFGSDENGIETRQDVVVDITDWAERDSFGNITDGAFDALASLIEGQLSTYGWAVSIVNRAITFALSGTGPVQSLGMDVNTGGTNLRDLGFVRSQLDTGDVGGVEVATFDVHQEISSVTLGEMNLDVLRGTSSLRFDIQIGDETQTVNVNQPTGGWGVDTGGDLMQGFVDAFNASLDLKGIGINVVNSTISAPVEGSDPATFETVPALQFDLDPGTVGAFKIGLDLDSLTRANSLQGMFGWMIETVGDIPCFPGTPGSPGFEIEVDLETGEVIFDFDPFVACGIDADGNVTTGLPTVIAGLSIDGTSLGDFANVDLQAELEGTLSAELHLAAGFNIFDIQADFAESENAASSVLDNVFFDELSLNAVLDASATNIVAGLEIGMVEIGVGTGDNAGDPANFIAINTELDITIVGQSDGAFSDRLTGTQLTTLGTDTGAGSRLTDLIGRVDLQGGIAVTALNETITNPDGSEIVPEDRDFVIDDGAGGRIDFDLPASTLSDPDDAAAEDRQNVLDLITIQNGDDREENQEYVMVAINLQGVDLGFGGLVPTAVEDTPIFATIADIFDPVNTTDIVYDIEELACLTLVDPNLILDAMIGLGDVIATYEDNLQEFFPFLFEDVPLLNDALLATFNFTEGFNAALQELRDAGGFSFENINDVFASAFGDGAVTLELLTEDPITGAAACELYFNLDIDFLSDFTQEIPFNFNLVDLLGSEGLATLLEEADDNESTANQGDETVEVLGDLLTNLVDARADAALVLDPELGLDLRLGIDIAALGGLQLSEADGGTTLAEIANVTSVVTNGAGFNDLRIDWEDTTTGEVSTYFLDVDSLLPEGDNASDATPDGTIPEATLDDIVVAIGELFDADTSNGLTISLVTNADGDTVIEIKDPNSILTDTDGLDALFGSTEKIKVDGGDQPELAEAEEYPARVISLADPVDPDAAYSFTISIAGSTPITIDVPAADPLEPRDLDGLVSAINTAINTADPSIPAATDNAILISNSLLGDDMSLPGETPLLRLLLVRLDSDTGALTLETTSFANSQGWPEFSIDIVDVTGALFNGTASDSGGEFIPLSEAESYTPRELTLTALDELVPDEFEPRVLIIAPPLPDAALPPTIPLPTDGFTLTIDISVPGSTATDTLDLVIAEDPERLTPDALVEALNDALRFTAPDTVRELNLGSLTTSPETGSMVINTDLAEVMILAGNIFEFEVNNLNLVTLKTTDALIKSGLPEFGFEVSYTAVAPGLQTGGTVFGNVHGTGSAWEPTDASKGYSFAIQIGDGDPTDIILEEDFSRVTRADLVEALNAVLLEADVQRSLISDTAVIGTTTTLSQLLQFKADGNDLTLQTTNFAQVNGYDEFDFYVLGNDTSHDITFEVSELEESNIAQALGFTSAIELAELLDDPSFNVVEGDISSSAIKAKDIAHDAPIVFIDTEATQITASLSVGTPDGLNMVLALGPLEVGIDGGSAFIGASGGEGRGYIAGVIEDIDETDDGRYDLAHLYGIFQSDDPDFLPLFGLDVDFETRIDLPFSGGFGLLNPEAHGFVYESTLLRTTGNPDDPNDNVVSASELFGTVETALIDLYSEDVLASDADAARAATVALLDEHFVGDAQALALIGLALTDDEQAGLSQPIADLALLGDTRAGDLLPDGTLPSDYYTPSGDATYGPHFVDLNLPGIGLFNCAGILDLLNDPLAIVNGLDVMAGTIQGFIDDFLADIDLPLIGENLAIGAGFFDDLIYDVLDDVRSDLEQPLPETGALPTTLDLVNVLMNRALNLMFDPEELVADEQYIAAAIYDGPGEAAIYGSLSFDFEVFSEDLAVALALEIPGLNLNADAGTDINLRTTLDIDLGFGLDCDGFFVLNDTESPEIALVFEATANDFQGGFDVGGVLEIEATATSGQQTSVVATIGLDLFGESGIETGAGLELDRTYDFQEAELTELVANDANSAFNLDADRFDNTVYLPQIDFGTFANFTFSADVQVHLDLLARFDVGGGAPELTTDFIFTAEIPQNGVGQPISTDILITDLKFDDIRLRTGTIAELVGTVLNPIGELLSPVTDIFDELSTVTPLNYALTAANTVFPILNIGNQITDILGTLGSLPTSHPDGICIGTYNFLGFKDDVLLSEFRASDAIFTPCVGVDINFGLSSSVSGPGLNIDIPLLTDPSHALNILLGNFDRVSLVEAEFTLLDADINANISAAITGNLGLPGWISSAVRSGFTAEVDIDFDASLTVGYDLSGIVNFANSYDPERLLDGVFIDAAPGALIDGSIRGNFGLNAGIAGASGSLRGDVDLTFTDPNSDGKLRLTELLSQIELLNTVNLSNPGEVLGVFFTGEVSFGAALRIWGGINFPSPLPDLSFSTTVFDTNLFTYNLAPTLAPPEIADGFGSGSNTTAVLNVGARAGNNLSSISADGNDNITVAANGFVSYTSNGQVFSSPGNQTVDPNRGIVIAAGEGTNTIDLSALTSGTSASIVYSGNGNDTINLARNGTHVVFAGDGADTINLVNGSGTYYIFAEEGADTLNLTTAAGGTVYVFGGDDFGMREHFLETFSVSGQTISTFVNPDTIAAQFNAANLQLSGAGNSLSAFENLFTRSTQLTGQSDDEVIQIGGSGNANVFTGRGDDLITVSGASDADIYTGGGNDQINFTGTGTTRTEAGAGADLVTFTGGSNVAYGWGAVSAADEATGVLDHLLRSDGDDIIIGAAGNDTFFGQFGNDILGGGAGDDTLDGGFDDDLISGGNLEVRTLDSDGNPSTVLVDLTDPDATDNLQSRLQVTTQDLNDGSDSLRGGAGKDILLGGGGDDTLSGGDGADLIVGDYGQINVSTNRVAETFVSTGISSLTAGTDILDGGAGGDILIAGGAQNVDVTEVIVDLIGDNIVFGDFGLVEGSRILEVADGYRGIASDLGTRDDITTGAGNDVIIGGERDDIINAGLGGDFVIGDLGSFVPADGLVNNDYFENGAVISNVSLNEGNDQISFGVAGFEDLFDVAIGGGGDDSVTSVNGGLSVVGDYGQIVLNPLGVQALLGLLPLSATATQAQIDAFNVQIALIERLVESVETIDVDGNVYGDIESGPRFGDDSVTTTEGGNVFTILGGNTMAADGTMGGDTVSLADGLSYVLTDDGRLTIEQIAAEVPGGSFGRIKGEAFSTEFAGNDTVTTGEGRDIILTGDLDDVVSAGDGLNIVITDNGTLETSDVLTAAPTRLISVAGARDGNDTYTGGADDDLVVLGGGITDGANPTDTAILGEGENFALGDSGQISITLGVDGSQAVSLVSDPVLVGNNDGIDQITAGSSDDFIVLGGGGDIAELGDGSTYVLASSGSLNTTTSADGRLTVQINSADVVPNATDGDDSITAGLGDDFIVLGLGSDSVNLGDGTVHLIGGEGTLTYESTAAGERVLDLVSQLPTLSDLDGDERIIAGNGDDFIILGLGNDYVETGDGENRVIADQGQVMLDTEAGTETLTFLSPELGGDDTVFGGAGNDQVLLSQGDDYAETFDGNDLVAGDNATITRDENANLHTMVADTAAFGGDDEIISGAGNDLIVGSFGDDTIETGTGDDFALGDLGNLVFRNETDVERLVYTVADVGGDDVITAAGLGSNILIGQFGDDIITGGDEDDILIGDLSELQLSSFAEVLPGQSHVERIQSVTSIAPELGFDDTLNGGVGNDVLVGGFGADSLLGGDGQDFLFGDMVDITRSYDRTTQIETLDFETNFPFLTGGTDTLDGQAGGDVVVGGLGADLFFGNTETDILAGDAFTARFITFFPTGLVGSTPERLLAEVNFAAFSPVDVLTNAQVLSSVGAFSNLVSYNGDDETDGASGRLLASENSPFGESKIFERGEGITLDHLFFLRVIEGFFNAEDIIKRIAETIYFGTDIDLAVDDLTEAFRAYILSIGVAESQVDMAVFETLLRRVLADATETSESLEASASQDQTAIPNVVL